MSRIYDFTIIPGDQETRIVEVNQGDDSDFDLTGYTFICGADVGGAVYELEATAVEPTTEGKVKVVIQEEQTATMRTIGRWWLKRVKDDEPITVAHGRIKPDVGVGL